MELVLEHSDRLSQPNSDNNKVIAQLFRKLKKISPSLTAVVDPQNKDKQKIVLTTLANNHEFSALDSLFKYAPPVKGWEIRAYIEVFSLIVTEVDLGTEVVGHEDIYFSYTKLNNNKIGIELLVDCQCEINLTAKNWLRVMLLSIIGEREFADRFTFTGVSKLVRQLPHYSLLNLDQFDFNKPPPLNINHQAEERRNSAVDYNRQFDQIILNDSSRLEEQSALNGANNFTHDKTINFEKGKQYDSDFFRSKLDSPTIKTTDLIEFIKNCIEHRCAEFLNYEYYHQSFRYSRNPELASLLLKYFNAEDLNSSDTSFKALTFAVANKLPSAKELIDQYLNERAELNTKYSEETALPITLFNMGFEVQAIELLEFFVGEYITRAIPYFHNGDLDERTDAFALLGLLGSEQVAKRAIDAGFKLCNYDFDKASYSLMQFLEYIEPVRFSECVHHRFEQFPQLEQMNNQQVTNYFYFFSVYGKYIAPGMGFNFWKYFIDTKPFIDSGKFNQDILRMASLVMSPSIDSHEQKEIINFITEHIRELNSDNAKTDSTKIEQFIKVIKLTQNELSDEEVAQYIPDKYKKYGQLTYLLNAQNCEPLYPCLKELKSDFVDANIAPDFIIDKYTEFLHAQKSFGIYEVLQLTQKMIHFDAEAATFPVDYQDLFTVNFLPTLTKAGLTNIELSAQHEIAAHQCQYRLSIRLNDALYSMTFSEHSSWYNVENLALLINRCLIKNQSNLRLISIDTHDQTALLGLFEPNDFIPLMKKYRHQCWAVKYGDLLEGEYH